MASSITQRELAEEIEAIRPELCKCSMSILKNDKDVEDAVSEMTLRAYENIDNLKQRESLRFWLYRIIQNVSKSMYVKRKHQFPVEGSALLSFTDKETGSEFIIDEIIKKDEADALNRALPKIAGKYRKVIEMYYFSGCSVSQIADELSISEGTVKSRLYRGRRDLKKILSAIICLFMAIGATSHLSVLMEQMPFTDGLAFENDLGDGCDKNDRQEKNVQKEGSKASDRQEKNTQEEGSQERNTQEKDRNESRSVPKIEKIENEELTWKDYEKDIMLLNAIVIINDESMIDKNRVCYAPSTGTIYYPNRKLTSNEKNAIKSIETWEENQGKEVNKMNVPETEPSENEKKDIKNTEEREQEYGKDSGRSKQDNISTDEQTACDKRRNLKGEGIHEEKVSRDEQTNLDKTSNLKEMVAYEEVSKDDVLETEVSTNNGERNVEVSNFDTGNKLSDERKNELIKEVCGQNAEVHGQNAEKYEQNVEVYGWGAENNCDEDASGSMERMVADFVEENSSYIADYDALFSGEIISVEDGERIFPTTVEMISSQISWRKKWEEAGRFDDRIPIGCDSDLLYGEETAPNSKSECDYMGTDAIVASDSLDHLKEMIPEEIVEKYAVDCSFDSSAKFGVSVDDERIRNHVIDSFAMLGVPANGHLFVVDFSKIDYKANHIEGRTEEITGDTIEERAEEITGDTIEEGAEEITGDTIEEGAEEITGDTIEEESEEMIGDTIEEESEEIIGDTIELGLEESELENAISDPSSETSFSMKEKHSLSEINNYLGRGEVSLESMMSSSDRPAINLDEIEIKEVEQPVSQSS